jgi:predicted acetyltransferase
VAEMVQQLAFSPANLPDHEERRGVRRLMLPDRPSVETLYERVAAQGHFALERKPGWWSQRLWGREGDWVVYEGRRRGQIEGYLYYEVDASPGPFKLSVTLEEFVAVTPEAHRGLVGYLAALRDQVSEIHFAAPADGVWPLTLLTGQNLRPGAELSVLTDTGNISNGAMLRLTDVKAALERWPLPPQARGELTLEVEDPVLPQNARSWRVGVRDGGLRLGAEGTGPARRTRLPRLRAEADLLASLVAGTISPLRAAEAGLVGSSDGAAEVFERWFRARPAYLYPLNAF